MKTRISRDLSAAKIRDMKDYHRVILIRNKTKENSLKFFNKEFKILINPTQPIHNSA